MPTVPKIAIVYDWVTTKEGGAEKVLVALHQAFPEADLYTSLANLRQAQWAQNWHPTTSFLQALPGLPSHHRAALGLLPLAFESLDLSTYHIVISVTSAFAKGILTRPDQLHICYLLTPPRFLYSHVSDYFSPVTAWLLTPVLKYLRWWDRVAAWRPDVLIALSQRVAQRSSQTYHRSVDSVIYPTIVEPVIAEPPSSLPNMPFLVVVSRLVSYKRLDLVILACQQLGIHLYLIGAGPERQALENLVTKPTLIHFLGQLTTPQVRWYLSQARALVMPGVEDFGITALEAATVGTPTILHTASGAAEVLQSDEKILLTALDLEELKKAMTCAMTHQHGTKQVPLSSSKYVTTTFVRQMQRTVLDQWSHWTEERNS